MTARLVTTARSGAVSRFAMRSSTVQIFVTALIFFVAHGGSYRMGGGLMVWMLAYGLTALWVLRAPARASRMIVQAWPIFVIPLFALASTVWSVDSGRTFSAAIQLVMTTLISLRIAQTMPMKHVLYALALATGTGVVLSVLNMLIGFLPPVYEVNKALLGIFSQKTFMGKAAFWTSLSIVGICALHRIPLVGLIVTFATFPLASLALSVTGTMGYTFVALLFLLLQVRFLPAKIRVGLPLLIAALTVIFTAIYTLTGGNPIADVLALAGKGTTLTGRTVLWAIGYDVWFDSPIAGVGFNAFWTSAEYEPMVRFIDTYIDEGLNGFHNGYVEVSVGLGIVGLIYLIGMMGVTAGRLVRWYFVHRTVDAAVWLCIFLAIAVLALVEDSFFKPHSAHYMLIVISYSIARNSVSLNWQTKESRPRD